MQLSKKIRLQTKTLHDKLEERHHFVELMKHSHLDSSVYTDILCCFYRLLVPFENIVSQCEQSAQYYQPKQSLILLDLNELNRPIEPDAVEAFPINTGLSVLAILYIFNGSNHGSKVISTHLKKYQKHLPVNFFSSSMSYTRASWLSFQKLLDEQPLDLHQKIIDDVAIIYQHYLAAFSESVSV